MTAHLLHTKLSAPPLRPDTVPRPHLIEKLNLGLRAGRRLILLSAPAGFGKTTLLAEWLGHAKGEVAWLSLDEGDNDRARFQSYLVAALQDIHPDLGLEAQAMLLAPQRPPDEATLTSLLNDVNAAGHTTTLVLDDYHLIHSLPIHEMLAFVLEHLPANMRLAISTREDPPLPLSRLRARAQAVELRQADLQFTLQETGRFCRNTMHLDLAAEDLAALQQRTEGWIAGLQLAALSLQDSSDPARQVQALTGSHRYILDYLIEEVFGRQSPAVQQFLLSTSILERLSAPLCDALTGRTDGREMLLALERGNLFLYSLDVSRQWYRYHHLFAELLAHRLRIESGDQIPTLHRQASQWYAENGYPADAMRHALCANDWESAAQLLEQITEPLLNQGQVATLLGWYRALPQTVLHDRPRLCYEYSWLLILTEQIELANEFLALAESAADGEPPFVGQIAVARAFVARMRGDVRHVIELSQQALSLLAEDDHQSRAVAAVNVGIAQWYRGHLTEAARALDEAAQAAAEIGNDYAHITARVFLARLQAAQGGLQEAAAAYRRLIHANPQIPTIVLARVDLANLLIEWNDLSAAAEQARHGREQGHRTADSELELDALSVLCYIRQLQGQAESVRALCDRRAQLMQHPGLTPFAISHALGYCALTALAAGDLQQAARWLDQAPPLDQLPSVHAFLLLGLVRARLLLAQGRAKDAAHLLARRLEVAHQAGLEASLVETHAMLALCSPSTEDRASHLSRALHKAASSGHVRAFLDLGHPMAEQLEWAVDHGVEQEYALKLLSAYQGSSTQAPGLAQRTAPIDRVSSLLVEPLSEREIAVLRLLSKSQTYQEIAQTLYVSLNTVKTHVKHIYAKLQVHSRRQALRQAHELGLL
jgi:LuxR family maltose regulon positive regulatory protein